MRDSVTTFRIDPRQQLIIDEIVKSQAKAGRTIKKSEIIRQGIEIVAKSYGISEKRIDDLLKKEIT